MLEAARCSSEMVRVEEQAWELAVGVCLDLEYVMGEADIVCDDGGQVEVVAKLERMCCILLN
jgi:hypothetical protein